MSEHAFIFQPGVWEGSGKISFSMADDELDFTMRWTILPAEENKIYFNQLITIPDLSQTMKNNFCISNITQKAFNIELENQMVGKVYGKGVIDAGIIAWEFREPNQAFDGFELYELQENKHYKMRAEFTGGEGLRTYVRGTITSI